MCSARYVSMFSIWMRRKGKRFLVQDPAPQDRGERRTALSFGVYRLRKKVE